MGKRDCETEPRYYKMGQFSKTDAASVDERCNLVLENLSSSSKICYESVDVVNEVFEGSKIWGICRK